MNITQEWAEDIHLYSNLEKYQLSITEVFGIAPEPLYVYNTWQFSDYSKYESSIFNVEDKRRQKAEQFPLDCRSAYDLGVRQVKRIKELQREGGNTL